MSTASKATARAVSWGRLTRDFLPLPFSGGNFENSPKKTFGKDRDSRHEYRLRVACSLSSQSLRLFGRAALLMSFTCLQVARAWIGEPHHTVGGEYHYRCPNHDDSHPSLKINEKKDKWICGPCNKSGGAYTLAAFLGRLDPCEKRAVMKALTDRGLVYEKMERVKKEPQQFYPVKEFYYTPVLRNVRFETKPTDKSKPEKKFQWQHLEGDSWEPGAGGMLKPLYVNERFKKGEPFDTAVGFEGEGKCDLAGELGIPAFSFKFMNRAECQKLAGLEIVLWPDGDQAGFKQAKDVALMLKEAKLKVRMCSVPIEFPIGGDIVDAVKILKWTRERIDQFLASATSFPVEVSIGRRLRRVESKQMEWLWKNRVPCNGITILDGDPGTGKGLLTTDLAARITTGRQLPFDEFQMPPANVIVLGSEDSLEHTIRPRFEAASADLDRVIAIPYSSEKAGEVCFTRLPRDLKILSKAIEQEQAKLVIIDVLVSYIPAELSTRNDQDVRLALAPLAELCDKKNIACICNRHLNKNQGGSAMYRGGGSIGITGAARSVLLLAKGEGDVRTLAVVKSNLGLIPPAANFVVIAESGIPSIRWIDETQRTADDLLAGAALKTDVQAQRQENSLSVAMEFLSELLKDGPVESDRIRQIARDACMSWHSVIKAKESLGVKPTRRGGSFGKWMWEMRGKGGMIH